MLNSSVDYIRALRERNYLLFLEWPTFIIKQYCSEDEAQHLGAEALQDLILFEWIRSDCCEQDVRLLVQLYALRRLEQNPLSAQLDYSLTAISVAVIEWMVYQGSGTPMLENDTTGGCNTKKEIVALVKAFTNRMILNEQVSQRQQALFFQWVDEVTLEQIQQIKRSVEPIVTLRTTVFNYLNALKGHETLSDELKASRTGVVTRLFGYVQDQMALTTQVREELHQYVLKIRGLNPQPFEEPYLSSIAPRRVIDNALHRVAALGLRFFATVLSSSEDEAIVSSQLNSY